MTKQMPILASLGRNLTVVTAVLALSLGGVTLPSRGSVSFGGGSGIAQAKPPTQEDIDRCKREKKKRQAEWERQWRSIPGNKGKPVPPDPFPYRCGPVPDDPAPSTPETPDQPTTPKPTNPTEPTRPNQPQPDTNDPGLPDFPDPPTITNDPNAPVITPDAPGDGVDNSDKYAPLIRSLLKSGQTYQELLHEAKTLVNSLLSSQVPFIQYGKLTSRNQRLVDSYTNPRNEVAKRTVHKATRKDIYCTIRGGSFEAKALLGNTILTYWQQVKICAVPGVWLQRVEIVSSGGETKTPTWSYEGQQGKETQIFGGTGYTLTREKFTQGIVFKGASIGSKTYCFHGESKSNGDFSYNDSCRLV